MDGILEPFLPDYAHLVGTSPTNTSSPRRVDATMFASGSQDLEFLTDGLLAPLEANRTEPLATEQPESCDNGSLQGFQSLGHRAEPPPEPSHPQLDSQQSLDPSGSKEPPAVANSPILVSDHHSLDSFKSPGPPTSTMVPTEMDDVFQNSSIWSSSMVGWHLLP